MLKWGPILTGASVRPAAFYPCCSMEDVTMGTLNERCSIHELLRCPQTVALGIRCSRPPKVNARYTNPSEAGPQSYSARHPAQTLKSFLHPVGKATHAVSTRCRIPSV